MARKGKKSLRKLLALHRTVGLISAVFVLLLAVTGLLLQHTNTLRLDTRFLKADFWLSWYNLEAPAVVSGYVAGGHTAVRVVDRLYFDTRAVAEGVGELVGMVQIDALFLVAEAAGNLFLLTDAGELVERLSPLHGVPDSVSGLARGESGNVLLIDDSVYYEIDVDNLDFTPVEPTGQLVLSRPGPLPQELTAQLSDRYADSLLTVERLILDMHSGRLLGQAGARLMDVMAVLFIVMAISGIWIWSRRRARPNR